MTANAQTVVTDSTGNGRVLGDSPRRHRSSERNVLGTPVYYDTLGNVLGAAQESDSFYYRPKHHFLNRLEDEFSSTFFEISSLISSNDMALGVHFAYVPKRWGIYASGYAGWNHDYLTLGPVLRVSDCGDLLDWQLYGGLTFSRHLGTEMGFRLASTHSDGFCWSSVSMGLGAVNRHTYFTMGLSLALMPSLIFFVW